MPDLLSWRSRKPISLSSACLTDRWHRGYTGSYSHLQRFLVEWRRPDCDENTKVKAPVQESRAIDPIPGWQIAQDCRRAVYAS
jgi:hypothetical protein